MKTIAADLLAGFVALSLIMTGFITGILHENLVDQVLVVSAVFLIAGFLRGASPSNPWMKGLIVGLGAVVPTYIMAVTHMAFTSKPYLFSFMGASLLSAIAGVQVRRLWNAALRGTSVAVAATWMGVVIVAARLFVPAMLARLWTEQVNYAAPAFVFNSMNHGQITNASLHGKITVLAFWATWCGPCREELPQLDALYRRYGNNPKIAFLAVNSEGEDLASASVKANAFFTGLHLSLPIVLSDKATQKALGIQVLPTLLIIDQSGHVRVVHSGYDGAEDVDQIVSRQIAALTQ